MRFSYCTGQKPLDGFTIKRGVGKGGFGEVYFAISDGGKEVALKAVRGHADVELRGISQCLNLKHPNLVHLYDLRKDARGEPWVVMEYIAGEPLSAVLNRHPKGVPVDLAKQWFAELARGMAYLHDHGLVHRDLKPANVFLEAGIIKIGDYGLSKAMSASARTGQTQSIGTVHYMAPEIGTGNYNKQIDIYAAGIMLFEMLTGRVPFEGESAQEIMLKHLTAVPNLSELPEEFRAVVGKALAKNPDHRYASMTEFAQAVERIGQRVEQPLPPPPATSIKPVSPAPPPPLVWPIRHRLAELATSMSLAVALCLAMTLLWAAFLRNYVELHWAGQLFFLSLATSWVLLVTTKFWPSIKGDSWGRRLSLMACGSGIGMLALWLDGWPLGIVEAGSRGEGTERLFGILSLGSGGLIAAAGYISYFGLALGAIRWWRLTDLRRPSMFSLFGVLAAGFWGLVLLVVWPLPDMPIGLIVLIVSSMVVQWVSPHEPPPAPPVRKLRFRAATAS